MAKNIYGLPDDVIIDERPSQVATFNNETHQWENKQEFSPSIVVHGNQAPDYSALVDQIQKNNVWSADQAQKQMDFQERLFNEANDFNRDQAEIDRAFQQDSADKAMAFSSAEAEKNRAWQEMMSNTAHQREMADLAAAGLNPILAARNGASVGAGSTASSAQAAGYGASSSGTPSGAKGDTDESGTMAIAQLLGKMLDNQTEIQKMIVSAETARETADMYTGATRYAAELGQIASDIASQRSSEASRYAAGLNYDAQMSNPYYILGDQINSILETFGNKGMSAEDTINRMIGNDNILQIAHDKASNMLVNAGKSIWDFGRSIYNKITQKNTKEQLKEKYGKFLK